MWDFMNIRGGQSHRRRGAVAVLVAVSFAGIVGFAALTIDVGLLYAAKADLQNAADAAALAGVALLPQANDSTIEAIRIAERQTPDGYSAILLPTDVKHGHWDVATASFTQGGLPRNALRVTTRRTQERHNRVALFFARIWGIDEADVSATATALKPGGSGGRVRFLIDNEVFDKDVPAIEELADRLGVDGDDLLSDLNYDDFIDIPAGEVLVLPTGQVGDEGLFAINPSSFPYTASSDPSIADFLLFEEGGNTHGVFKEDLDPLLGVAPVSDPDDYASFVNPDQILVSPVYKSDISDTDPGVNALGERRGLVAFKILAVSADPPGSELPDITIEIVGPVDLSKLSISSGDGASGSVQIVK